MYANQLTNDLVCSHTASCSWAQVQFFRSFGYPEWWLSVVGLCEVGIAVLLLVFPGSVSRVSFSGQCQQVATKLGFMWEIRDNCVRDRTIILYHWGVAGNAGNHSESVWLILS